ncbi:hypothetical protein [Halorhabdus utahensis]|nr:hypothetical protein [Halorhabdus utahensis]
MPTRRRQQFIYAQALWMLGALLTLAALGALSLDLYVSVSWFGLIVIIGLTTPVATTPTWRSRLKWFMAGGSVVFGLIVLRRTIELLPSELVERVLPEILAMGAGL